MTDTSEAPNPPPADPGTTRNTPPGKKRLAVTLAVLVSFILTLPVLYKSTEIHRAPLPFDSIASLSGDLRSNPTTLPCRFQVVFLRPFDAGINPDDAADRLSRLVSDEMRRLAGHGSSFGGCGTNFSVAVSVDTAAGCGRDREFGLGGCLWHCGSAGVDLLDGSDEAIDELLWGALRKNGDECSTTNGGNVYTVVVAATVSEDARKARVVVGKHRHAWVVGEAGELDVVSKVARVFVEVFMRGGVVGGDADNGKGEFVPVGSDGSVTLSFSLLNSNPNDWIYDWDFYNMGEKMLEPVLDALSPVANFRVESQVLYYTPKSSSSSWNEKLQSYTFSEDDLPFFVNSKEWHLDTSIAAGGRSKVLQFVVYVPSANECPLLLQLPNKDISSTNGFISPMWGGVTVWNPSCSVNSSSHLVKNMISHQELHKLLTIFVGQLRLLFGLKSDYDTNEYGIFNLLPSERGFTEWELDFLFRYHTHFNMLSCANTLESLSNLVQSLPRMIVMDEIGKQVSLSLKAAGLAQENAAIGMYNDSSALSRQARALAEDAFFHPSIMSISYSSAEHYFAIYMPFFAPVTLHVLLATLKELRRYKQERVKHMAFLSGHVKIS